MYFFIIARKRNNAQIVLLTICLPPLFGGSVFAQIYSGSYTASRLPGQILDTGIFFKQLNKQTRRRGQLSGAVNGNVATVICHCRSDRLADA